MLSERLQILVSPEQRRRLEHEAGRRGTSIGSVVRDAIDARLGAVTEADRQRALDEIKKMNAGPALSPEELNEIFGNAAVERFERTRRPRE
ncbi:MAG TPA: hypothetical protein VFI37_01765 [Gaiellaceae bacterium]|jgi:hypothetical protein|nr:hypothetical protein [Gaiellaceae bacterium]